MGIHSIQGRRGYATTICSPVFSPPHLAPDCERFTVSTAPESTAEKGPVHVTFLLDFFDELKRRAPVK
jgi:hypothetical protein